MPSNLRAKRAGVLVLKIPLVRCAAGGHARAEIFRSRDCVSAAQEAKFASSRSCASFRFDAKLWLVILGLRNFANGWNEFAGLAMTVSDK